MTCSSGMDTSPFSSRLSSSAVPALTPRSSLGALYGSSCCRVSITSAGAWKMLLMFWNRKSHMKPRRTTSREWILRGIESTCSASSSTISPSSSSPITGKKFNSRRTFCLRESVSPPPHVVPEYRSFAYSSNTVSERAGSKSNTYAFSLRWYLPFLLNRQGFCARNAACTYSAGLFMFDSMRTPVHSGTVTPVVS